MRQFNRKGSVSGGGLYAQRSHQAEHQGNEHVPGAYHATVVHH
jgi:hypothetical protein